MGIECVWPWRALLAHRIGVMVSWCHESDGGHFECAAALSSSYNFISTARDYFTFHIHQRKKPHQQLFQDEFLESPDTIQPSTSKNAEIIADADYGAVRAVLGDFLYGRDDHTARS